MNPTIKHFRSRLAQAESDIFASIEQIAQRFSEETDTTIHGVEIHFKNVAPSDAPRKEYRVSYVTVHVNIR